MAFVDIVRGKELTRLRICAFPTCSNVVIDLSKNRSKRFCEAGCGNRAAVAAYRARKAAAGALRAAERNQYAYSVSCPRNMHINEAGTRPVDAARQVRVRSPS